MAIVGDIKIDLKGIKEYTQEEIQLIKASKSFDKIFDAVELHSQMKLIIKELEKRYREQNDYSDCKSIVFPKNNSNDFGIQYYSTLDYFMNLIKAVK